MERRRRSQCYECKHKTPIGSIAACKAFPNGIPEEILKSEHDHRKPFKGDKGVRFEHMFGEKLTSDERNDL